MRYQAIIQIVLVVVSLVIIFLVLQPKFESIRATEEEAANYDRAISNIDAYNSKLQSLLDQANSLSQDEIDALYTYMPRYIDSLRVARDVKIIVERNNGVLKGITSDDLQEVVEEGNINTANLAGYNSTDDAPYAGPDAGVNYSDQYAYSSGANGILARKVFELEILSDYAALKDILRDFERNAYPLRLIEFDYEVDGGSDLQAFKMRLETYAFGNDIVIDNNGN